MDVDVIWKAMTNAEKETYRRKEQCYNCGKQGHLGQDCPTKRLWIAAASVLPTPATVTTSTSNTAIPTVTPVTKESMEVKIQKMAKLSMKLKPEEQERLASKQKHLGMDFH
jgi:hypothetical protein